MKGRIYDYSPANCLRRVLKEKGEANSLRISGSLVEILYSSASRNRMEKDKGKNFKMTSIPIKIQRMYICKLNGNESVLIIVWNYGNRVSARKIQSLCLEIILM